MLDMRSIGAALIGLLCSFCAHAAEPTALRVAVSENWIMPVIGYAHGQSYDGIVHDLHQRIAQHLKRPLLQPLLAKARLNSDLALAKLDLYCNLSPKWVEPGLTQHYVWSVPYMSKNDVIVRRADSDGRREQWGETIGTITDYVYVDLVNDFASGKLQRDDARSQYLVLKKLQAKRYDFAVSNAMSLHWFNREYASDKPLIVHRALSEDEMSCLVRNQPDLPTQEILTLIKQLRDSGEIDQWLKRYR